VSGERTEAPSPRRLREARRSGQVAVSAELTGAAALVGGLGALAAVGPALLSEAARRLAAAIPAAVLVPTDPAVAGAKLMAAAGALARAALLPCAGAAAAATLAGLLQAGFLLAPAALVPRLERLDPLRGLRRLASPAALAGVALGLLRAAALLAVGALWLREALPSLPGLAGVGAAEAWRVLPALGALLWRLALVLVAFGLVDLLRARRRHQRSLRLTREEARRERREDEGDPQLRGERRRLHRGLLEAGPVARATVVIVNPTHLAVALRHERGGPDAPRVVAKGAGRAAAGIRSAARRAGVPVVRDVPLAHALHRMCEIGEELPEELYEAAAAILVHLYRPAPQGAEDR
jgi:type III secretion protein U